MSTLISLVERRDFLATSSAALFAMLAKSAIAAEKLKIGMIGAGNVGRNLGIAWTKAGHPVKFSSRHPEELKELVQQLGPNASAGTVAEAVAFADVILLAVPYGALPDLAKEHGAALAKKVLVLDATNPFPNRDGEIADKARAQGVGEFTARMFPGVKIVRAFNAFSAGRFSQGGVRDGARMGVPITGDDQTAIALANELVRETGYEPVLVGRTAFGKHLMPGTPLAGERTPEEIRKIAATLN